MTALADRLAALDRALALGADRLTDGERDRLTDVRGRVDARLDRGEDAIVIGLAGGTGSGKSSLFNALAGRELADVGVRRPVTTSARGLAIGDPEPAGRLLDWLDVPTRHHDDPGALPAGAVLVDLPDHDSVEVSHREIVDRFVQRVDVLVWVVDPGKYAQRALHQGYLRDLATHADVTIVVLNRTDELDEDGLETVRSDLRGLLDAEGLTGARVLATSARTGAGVDALREELAGEVRSRRAVAARVSADVVQAAAEVRDSLGALPPAPDADRADLLDVVAQAMGLSGVAVDARRAYVEDATRSARPLLSRWLITLLSTFVRPLRRWRSERSRRRIVEARVGAAEDLPVAVRHAVHLLVGDGVEVAPRWRSRLRNLAEAGARTLITGLARSLERVDLTPRPRRWWAVVAVLWTLVELVAVTGGGWLLASGVLVWLQLPPLPSPDGLGAVPLPSVLFLGGGALWALLLLTRRALVRRGAERHARRIDREVREQLATVVRRDLVEPVEAEVDAVHGVAAALEQASGRPGRTAEA